MKALESKLGIFDLVLGASLLTLGVLGLMTQSNLLAIPWHLPSGWKLMRWWPLGVVAVGALRVMMARCSTTR
jgi:hypothetical protein